MLYYSSTWWPKISCPVIQIFSAHLRIIATTEGSINGLLLLGTVSAIYPIFLCSGRPNIPLLHPSWSYLVDSTNHCYSEYLCKDCMKCNQIFGTDLISKSSN